jgi:hypothetical protein
MNTAELPQLVAQYRAGLEAEMTLLLRLESLAARQRETSEQGNLVALAEVSDQRDRVMAGLVRIEHELKPVRMVLLEHRRDLDGDDDFATVAALHHSAASLIERIVSDDRSSLAALKEAEQARRFAAQSIEQGESTLAAYRRVVSPPLSGSSLVNRKG